MSEEIAKYEPQQAALMRPIVRTADLLDLHKEVTEMCRVALVEGVDYGTIPGTERSGKKALLKAGAERLSVAFGVFPRYSVVSSEVDHDRETAYVKRKKIWTKGSNRPTFEEGPGVSLGLYRYVVRCELVARATGQVVADSIASCSSLESKYIDRPRDCENTVIKMAQKRAFVSATLNGFGLSDRFTLDEPLESEDGAAAPREEAPQVQQTSARERAAKAISAFAVFGVLPADLERLVGAQAQWDDATLARLGKALQEIKAAPVETRGETVRRIFDLEPGALG